MSAHRLYLLRHGRAEAAAPSGHDQDRELTDEGRHQARAAGLLLARLRSPKASTFCSPLLRCVQTARLVAPDPAPRTHQALRDDSSVEGLLALAREARPDSLLVGHQPSLLALAEALLGAPGPGFDLRVGALAGLERRDARWQLVVLLQPDVTLRLAVPGDSGGVG